MHNELFGFVYDYVMDDGHQLMIGRNEPFQSDELDDIAVNMIRENVIPPLLRMHVVETDMQVEFRYRLESAKKLSHHMRIKRITQNRFFDILLNIVQVLESAKMYMLNEHAFVLHEDFIFINEQNEQLQFVYLPLLRHPELPDYQEQLRRLALEMVTYVDELKGGRFQNLTRLLRQDRWSLADLHKELIPQTAHDANASFSGTPEMGMHRQPIQPYSMESVSAYTRGNANEPFPAQAVASMVLNDKPLSGGEKTADPRKPIYIICAAAVSLTAVWKVVLTCSLKDGLQPAIGVSVIIVLAALYALHRMRKNAASERNRLNERSIEQSAEPQDTPDEREDADFFSRILHTGQEAPASAGFERLQYEHAMTANHQTQVATIEPIEDNRIVRLTDQTTLLQPAETTEPLMQTEKQTGFDGGGITLSRKSEQGNRHIHVPHSRFIIGRGPHHVDHVENENGISRAHVEISFEMEIPRIQDLDSKNGTFLNDQRLVPYKLYEMKSGDFIRMAKIEFEVL